MKNSPELRIVIGADSAGFEPPPLATGLASVAAPADFRWLGHAGVSLAWAGRCLVFDPMVTRRLALLFSRALPVVLPHARPDIVLLSHTHRDHFHGPSLTALAPAVVVLPRGTAKYLPRGLTAHVVELAPDETADVDGFTLVAHPMRHPGWRQPLAPSYPALGYTVARDGFSVFHAGDSARSPVFETIGRTASPDIALLPIGAYSPRFVLRDKHLKPEEAVAAGLQLRARLTVPLHFGTFRLSFEPPDEPFPRFAREARRAGLRWCVPWGA